MNMANVVCVMKSLRVQSMCNTTPVLAASMHNSTRIGKDLCACFLVASKNFFSSFYTSLIPLAREAFLVWGILCALFPT